MRIEPEKNSILSVKNLTKSYGTLKAVDSLSFDIQPGEIFGFLGPNGAGKTTTISMICGLLKKDDGEILFKRCPLVENDNSWKNVMGFCPQDIVIWESLTCYEQLELTARLYGISGITARKRSTHLLDVLGLINKKNKLARTLSGGMKRRLNIALALIHEPQILILDEPQSGLDPQSRTLVREYIRSLAKKITVILTTHDMSEVDIIADRIAIIDFGKLLVLDSPKNLKNSIGKGEIMEIKIQKGRQDALDRLEKKLPDNLDCLEFLEDRMRIVGTDLHQILPTLLEFFRKNSIKIEDIAVHKKTLEDVFITLTGRKLRE